MGFPERIKHYRLAKGYTQKQLAERLGIKTGTVSAWEVGRNTPQASKLRKIANVLDVEIVQLTGELSDQTPAESTQPANSVSSVETKKHQLQLDNDVDKALQAVISYDGRPVTEHDRRVLSDIIKAYLNDRK